MFDPKRTHVSILGRTAIIYKLMKQAGLVEMMNVFISFEGVQDFMVILPRMNPKVLVLIG